MAAKRVTVIVDGRPYTVELDDVSAPSMHVRVDGRSFVVEVTDGQTVITPPPNAEPLHAITEPFPPVHVTSRPARAPGSTPPPPSGASAVGRTITAPMPGNILDIFVRPGDEVTYKQDLCVLEAMKMKNVIRSQCQGVIAEVKVQPGRAVSYGEVLFVLQ